MTEPILAARDVVQIFGGRRWLGFGREGVRAVDGVDLDIREGETLAIVGESGSGKSSLAKLLLALATPTRGTIAYRGKRLETLAETERRSYRRDVQAVFQDPAASLNPRMRVGTILAHVVARHGLAKGEGAQALIAQQLRDVGLDPPEMFMARYPHQLSGGQQQRVAIARAMILKPRLIIADEPLSSLDISVQTQLLELIDDLKHKTHIGFVIISHDLNAVQAVADRVAVMYRGRIVEIGTQVLARPQHPYTRALVDARLIADPRTARARQRIVLDSDSLSAPYDGRGCRFRSRCPFALEVCATQDPRLEQVLRLEQDPRLAMAGEATSLVACHLVAQEVAAKEDLAIEAGQAARQGDATQPREGFPSSPQLERQ